MGKACLLPKLSLLNVKEKTQLVQGLFFQKGVWYMQRRGKNKKAHDPDMKLQSAIHNHTEANVNHVGV